MVDALEVPIRGLRLISDSVSAGEVVYDMSLGNYRETGIGVITIHAGSSSEYFTQKAFGSDMLQRSVNTAVQYGFSESEILIDDCYACK
ncbi:hypothetical protein [Marinobacter nitratireducens]|uniref:hypothetical protein n=1 Tax=Marinobacter nitratireducens TaxID=1137280 RepID=UPI0012375383|nr:hypothetical protein [Marinobacter nitratireducens]